MNSLAKVEVPEFPPHPSVFYPGSVIISFQKNISMYLVFSPILEASEKSLSGLGTWYLIQHCFGMRILKKLALSWTTISKLLLIMYASNKTPILA